MDIENKFKIRKINKVHPHKFRRTMATMAIDICKLKNFQKY